MRRFASARGFRVAPAAMLRTLCGSDKLSLGRAGAPDGYDAAGAAGNGEEGSYFGAAASYFATAAAAVTPGGAEQGGGIAIELLIPVLVDLSCV